MKLMSCLSACLVAALFAASNLVPEVAMADTPNIKEQYQALDSEAGLIVDDMVPFQGVALDAMAAEPTKEGCFAVALVADSYARLLPILKQEIELNRQGHFGNAAAFSENEKALTEQLAIQKQWLSANCPSQDGLVKHRQELKAKYDALYAEVNDEQPALMELIAKTKPLFEGQKTSTACKDVAAYNSLLTKMQGAFVQLSSYNSEGMLRHDEEMALAPQTFAELLDQARSWQRGNCR